MGKTRQTESELISQFKQYLVIDRGLVVTSVDTYVPVIEDFLQWLESKSCSVDSVENIQIRDYLIFLKSVRNLNHSTVFKIRTALRDFFEFLNLQKIRDDNPTELLGSVRRERNIPEFYDYDKIDELLSCISVNDSIGLRDRAVFELIYSCGIRVSECTGLNISDYYPEEKRILVTGKRNKQRLLPMGEKAVRYLEEYIRYARNDFILNSSEKALFLSRNCTRITRQQIWNRLKLYGSQAHINVKVHTLRHSFASHLLQNGADLRSVQELLGHSDIRTTEIYTHIDTDNLYDDYSEIMNKK